MAFIFCFVMISLIQAFNLGSYYGANPYKELFAQKSFERTEVTQIGMEQSQTRLWLSVAAVGFNFLGLVFAIMELRKSKGPIYLLGSAPTVLKEVGTSAQYQ